MKLLYVIFTYQRPTILQEMLRCLFANTDIIPDEVLFIDDGSQEGIKRGLNEYCIDASKKGIPCHLFSFGKNQGLGWQWQLAFDYIKSRNPEKILLCEQDYLFRKRGIDEAIELLDLNPLSCCVSGYSNPDFYDPIKTNGLFVNVMKEHFGEDPVPRDLMHKPFSVPTKFGNVEIQLTTNSCGTYIMNWHRVKELLAKYPEMQQTCFDRAFHVNFPERRRYAGDGPVSSGITYYFYKDIFDRIKSGERIDLARVGAWLDICDCSISNHLNGGQDSLNGYIVPEGATFVSSPHWSDTWLDINPRAKQ